MCAHLRSTKESLTFEHLQTENTFFLRRRKKKKKIFGKGKHIFFREEELRKRKYKEKKNIFFCRGEEKRRRKWRKIFEGKYYQSRTNERPTEQSRKLTKFTTPHFTGIWKKGSRERQSMGYRIQLQASQLRSILWSWKRSILILPGILTPTSS